MNIYAVRYIPCGLVGEPPKNERIIAFSTEEKAREACEFLNKLIAEAQDKWKAWHSEDEIDRLRKRSASYSHDLALFLMKRDEKIREIGQPDLTRSVHLQWKRWEVIEMPFETIPLPPQR